MIEQEEYFPNCWYAVRINAATREKLRRLANTEKRSMAAQIEHLVNEALLANLPDALPVLTTEREA